MRSDKVQVLLLATWGTFASSANRCVSVKENKFPRETQIFIFTDGGVEPSIKTHGYKNYTWLLTDDNELFVQNNRNKIIRIKSKEKGE